VAKKAKRSVVKRVAKAAKAMAKKAKKVVKTMTPKTATKAKKKSNELPRDCRRLFGLSYAAMAACSSMA
jgi:hypothetical protein